LWWFFLQAISDTFNKEFLGEMSLFLVDGGVPMIKKEELQSFYNEYQEKINDMYYQYEANGEQEERQKLHREIEGMIYVLDSLRERFDLAPLGPKTDFKMILEKAF